MTTAGLAGALSPRVRAEALRFLRISVLAFLGQIVAVQSAGGHLPLGWSGLGALAAAAVESAIHQVGLTPGASAVGVMPEAVAPEVTASEAITSEVTTSEAPAPPR